MSRPRVILFSLPFRRFLKSKEASKILYKVFRHSPSGPMKMSTRSEILLIQIVRKKTRELVHIKGKIYSKRTLVVLLKTACFLLNDQEPPKF